MNHEYVYPIAAPPLNDILIPGAKDILFLRENKIIDVKCKAEDVIKPEYLNWHGIEWGFAIAFHKTGGYVGKIHIDNTYNKFMWGINWVYSGWGNLSYWEKDDIVANNTVTDNSGFTIEEFTAIKPAIKKYTLLPGAYLVNASVPHQPSGYQNRHVLSLRPKNLVTDWNSVVDMFCDIIKT